MTLQQQPRARTLSNGAVQPNKPFNAPRMSGPPASKSTLTTVPSSMTRASDRLRKLLLELQQAKLDPQLPKQAENDAVYVQWHDILPDLKSVDVATLVSFTKAQSLEMLRAVQITKKGLDAIYAVLSKKAVSADDSIEEWQLVLDWLQGVIQLALEHKSPARRVNNDPSASPRRQSLAAFASTSATHVAHQDASDPQHPSDQASQSRDRSRTRSEGAPSPARNDHDRLRKLTAPRSSGPNGLLSGQSTELDEEKEQGENRDEIGGPPQSRLGDLLLPPLRGKPTAFAGVPMAAIPSDDQDEDAVPAKVDKGKGRYVSPRDFLQQAPPLDDIDNDDLELSPPSNTLKPFGNGFKAGALSLSTIGGAAFESHIELEEDDGADADLPTSAQQAGPSRATTAVPAYLGLAGAARNSHQGLFARDLQANGGGLGDAEVDMLASDDDQLDYADPVPKPKAKQPIRRARPGKKKAVEVNPDGEEDQLESQDGVGPDGPGAGEASASETNGAGRPLRQSKTDAANKLGALDWSKRVPKKPTQVPSSAAQGRRGSSTQSAPAKKKGKKVERAYTSSQDEAEEDKPAKKPAAQKGKRRAAASPARSDSDEPAQTQRKSKRSRPAVEPAGSKRKIVKAGSSTGSKGKSTRALKQKDANAKTSQAKPRAPSVAASQAKKPKVEPHDRREGTRKSSRTSYPSGTATASQAMTPEIGFKPGEVGYVVNQTMQSKCWPALIVRVRSDRVRIAILPGKEAESSQGPKFRDVASSLQSGTPVSLERDDPPLLENSRSVALAYAMKFLEDRSRFRAWKNAAMSAGADGEGGSSEEEDDDDDDDADADGAARNPAEGEEVSSEDEVSD